MMEIGLSVDDLRQFSLISLILITLFIVVYIAAKRYHVGDYFESNLTTASLSLSQVQPLQRIHNPFVLQLKDSKTSSLRDGITASVKSSVPCSLWVCWGAKVADLYQIMYSSWPLFQNQDLLKQMLCSISHHTEEIHRTEMTTDTEIKFSSPMPFDLGLPPRNRYPLVIILLNSEAVNDPWSSVQHLQEIVSLITIIHLRDEHCPAESHIVCQLVKCPLGAPCDLRQLYMCGLEEHAHTWSSDAHSATANSIHSSLCSVCQAAPVEKAILPCRHACVCAECCTRLINCPICRSFIISVFTLDSL